MTAALVEEATRRSGVVWLLPAGTGPGRALWHVWHAGAAHVVGGGAEQELPVLADGDRVLVVVRSRARRADRLVQWWARVRELAPGTGPYDEVVAVLSAQRLNAPDGDEQPRRWARESRVLSLVPDGTVAQVDRSGG